MDTKDRPKALFINFTEKEIKSLKNLEGVEAELGFVTPHSPSHFYPSPAHDYDIVIVKIDQDSATNVASNFSETINDYRDGNRLMSTIKRGFYLGFLGSFQFDNLGNFGLGWLSTKNADPRDKHFERANHYDSNFDFLFDKHSFHLPIPKYINIAQPLSPLRVNRMGEVVAAYASESFAKGGDTLEDELRPTLLLTPFFENTLDVVDDVLRVVKEVRTDLFPALSSPEWEKEEFFIPKEVRGIEGEISKKVEETKKWIEAKKKEGDKLKVDYAFLTQILKADDQSFSGDERLSVNVKKVLELLGFEVTDVDKEIQTSIRKEDFWIVDGNYFALGEVTGTEAKNPKVTEYNGLLGRMNTILKRKDIPCALSKKGEIRGILIVNHDRKSNPLSRPDIYTGENEEIVEASLEQGISILSTVELYKITKAVKEGDLSKVEARKIIKAGGRIKFE